MTTEQELSSNPKWIEFQDEKKQLENQIEELLTQFEKKYSLDVAIIKYIKGELKIITVMPEKEMSAYLG